MRPPCSKLSTKHQRIIDLPSKVIDNIMMRLPLKEAGRASILSRDWRHIWARLPQLVFNDDYCKQLDDNNYLTSQDKLMKSIYEVLILHRAPILKFSLAVQGLKSCSDIDRVLEFLFRNDLEDLTLRILDVGGHTLTSSFFSYQQFKYLELSICELRPPKQFLGFPNLVSLILRDVKCGTDGMQTLISRCPLLEYLKIYRFKASQSFEIKAPNLRCLLLACKFSTLSIQNVPKLVDATLVIVLEQATSIDKFFSRLGSISYLKLFVAPGLSVTGGVKEGLRPAALSSLKHMHLVELNLNRMQHVSCAIWLIRNSPSVERIEIDVSCNVEDDGRLALDRLNLQNSSDLNHLRVVEMRNILGRDAELEFIRFFLAKSPKLMSYVVHPKKDIDVEQKLDILRKISVLRRASPTAEINFL